MIQRHPTYWFEDGDTILHHKMLINDDHESETLYRIHFSKLTSAGSPEFFKSSSQHVTNLSDDVLKVEFSKPMVVDTLDEDISNDLNGCNYVVLDRKSAIDIQDLAHLLDHVYGERKLNAKSDLPRIISLVHITGPDQLNMPALHEEAKMHFVDSLPGNSQELACFQCECAERAMALAIRYDISQARKSLLYYLATQTHQELNVSIPSHIHNTISNLSHSVSSNLISFFTPLLFTPPPTSHMECTDALAEHWMPLVISPAIDDSAMGKPLQTFEKMKNVNWTKYGICEDCVEDKKKEWSEEQDKVWELMDGWISDSAME
ncbi:hypothetical protein EV361DRAFT_147655 [Lentinula raphanica]|uniref:Uncharacterized protein n=1 Tax=Lentinula raphanica TaxID=153919 RepID=A0AA38NZ57_9AGAR|nr:hypothetical protein F5880DRAFT_1285929 [Lentinula raphanica]KAJ3833348.1 hypothetical protein F5878DRAFT_410324 [Lentinula raphanica]KAJ3977054.1 hypothetical protein EV361DRAFT_147655 [Lentinula raphanica]